VAKNASSQPKIAAISQSESAQKNPFADYSPEQQRQFQTLDLQGDEIAD